MKIRLMGTEQECDAAVRALTVLLNLIEVSRPYSNRGDSSQVRVYVEAELRPTAAIS